MFKIKKIEVKNNYVYITDSTDKTYSVSINDSRVSDLLGLASNESKSARKSIKYMNFYYKIATLCTIISSLGAVSSTIWSTYLVDVFFLMYGSVALGGAVLMLISKKYTQWLKKCSINNDYWEEIYNIIKINNITKTNNYNKTSSINYSNSYNINNSYKKETPKIDNSNECTYSYSKSQIIQDYDEKSKVKTYKKY